MSLVSLLSESERKEILRKQKAEIVKPKDIIKPELENKFRILKTCKIINLEGLYVIGVVLSGALISGMTADFHGRHLEIAEVESNLGDVAKKGMKTGLIVKGIGKQELDFDNEEIELDFHQK